MLDFENRLEINELDIKDFFGDQYEESLQFLVDSKLVSKEKIKLKYQDVYFFTNDLVFFESLKFNIDKLEIDFKINLLQRDNFIEDIGQYHIENSLNIFILNPFDYIKFQQLTDYLIENNFYAVFCFAYDSSFYITNIYNHEWNNPCPKCFFSNLESSLRAKNKVDGKANFQTVIDLIYNNRIEFVGEIPTTKRMLLNIINELCEIVENPNLNLTAGRIKICYLNGEVEYDTAIHWDLCNCFER